jgi:hypothetical protein
MNITNEIVIECGFMGCLLKEWPESFIAPTHSLTFPIELFESYLKYNEIEMGSTEAPWTSDRLVGTGETNPEIVLANESDFARVAEVVLRALPFPFFYVPWEKLGAYASVIIDELKLPKTAYEFFEYGNIAFLALKDKEIAIIAKLTSDG